MPSWRHLGPEERPDALLPGTYLREGEAPDAGALRVLRDMLRARSGALSERPRVFSATSASDWYPGHRHWDVAFVYDARGVELPARPPSWWRTLAWVAPAEARAREFGWNADLARALGVAR
jgi:ADP-ribose pyrophosphatase YjhB (NUDIX family)